MHIFLVTFRCSNPNSTIADKNHFYAPKIQNVGAIKLSTFSIKQLDFSKVIPFHFLFALFSVIAILKKKHFPKHHKNIIHFGCINLLLSIVSVLISTKDSTLESKLTLRGISLLAKIPTLYRDWVSNLN